MKFQVTYKYWRLVSSNNSQIFSSVFPGIPHDSIASLNDLSSITEQPMNQEKQKLLLMTKGHLCDFPLGFLRNESLRPEFVAEMKLRTTLDKTIFQ
jgi:hypothetical protein